MEGILFGEYYKYLTYWMLDASIVVVHIKVVSVLNKNLSCILKCSFWKLLQFTDIPVQETHTSAYGNAAKAPPQPGMATHAGIQLLNDYVQ